MVFYVNILSFDSFVRVNGWNYISFFPFVNVSRLQKTIHHLPDKTMLHVFGYLHQKDLCRLAHVCKKWKLLAYDGRLWSRVSFRPDYGGLHIGNVDVLVALIATRFSSTLRYIELPAELIMPAVFHELANRCPNVKYVVIVLKVNSFKFTVKLQGRPTKICKNREDHSVLEQLLHLPSSCNASYISWNPELSTSRVSGSLHA